MKNFVWKNLRNQQIPYSGDLEEALREREKARELRLRAEAITRQLEIDKSQNGYAKMVMRALGVGR